MSGKLLESLKAFARTRFPEAYRGLARASHRLANLRPSRSSFTAIYQSNGWDGTESISGPGSDHAQTRIIRARIPELLRELGVKSMLDAPCGDLHWIKDLDLGVERYVGGDIVPDLVARNREAFSREAFRSFQVLDITSDPIPRVDLIFCRDCLVHLPLAEARKALRNFRSSGSRWLLTTTFPATRHNDEVLRGRWRPLDLTKPPFNLPAPARLINEGCTEQAGRFPDKSLGLWPLDGLDA